MRFAVIVCLGLACILPARAEDPEKSANRLAIGERAPAWVDLPGVDGKKHCLEDIRSEFVVVAFVANHCPLCRFQERELSRIARAYGEHRVQVVAISVSRFKEDSILKMRERAEAARLPYAYLRDETQEIGRRFRVTRTPTVFLLNKERKIAYSGALDDDGTPIKEHYLRDALEASLEGRSIEHPLTQAQGCGIQYD
jgi:peroxiredoxin